MKTPLSPHPPLLHTVLAPGQRGMGRRRFLRTAGCAATGAWLTACADSPASDGAAAGADGGADGSAVDADGFATDGALDDDTGQIGDAASQDAEADTAIDGADGLAGDGAHDAALDAAQTCSDPLVGGKFEALVPFVDEGGKLMSQKYGQGLDGRYYTDLTALDTQTMTMPIGKFYVRTLLPDLLDTAKPWKLTVDGLVNSAKTLATQDLAPLVTDQGVHLMECSGNGKGGHFGLMSAAQWAGVPVTEVLKQVTPKAAGKRVLIEGFDKHSKPSVGGHSQPGASWIFTPAQLAGAFLATEMNGQPLPPDHGAPIRLLVPGWYGCCNIKWVTRIAWVDDDVAATSQMKEFASRTHQKGVPALAKDYQPATLDQAAMPIRVERWVTANGATVMRIVGVMWGGSEPTDKLTIRIGATSPVPVDLCPKVTTNQTWTLWTHIWTPPTSGKFAMTLHIDDPAIATQRLDLKWYRRVVVL
ncbi:MAG: molybdopterin-dependent oxidoreductase [Myxococcales bacterium]|nr:molybdopterin-dependent oxidoreductase [Myxococcales bacterium]